MKNVALKTIVKKQLKISYKIHIQRNECTTGERNIRQNFFTLNIIKNNNLIFKIEHEYYNTRPLSNINVPTVHRNLTKITYLCV